MADQIVDKALLPFNPVSGAASPEVVAAAKANATSVANMVLAPAVEAIPGQVRGEVASQVPPAVDAAARDVARTEVQTVIASDPSVVAAAAAAAQSDAGLTTDDGLVSALVAAVPAQRVSNGIRNPSLNRDLTGWSLEAATVGGATVTPSRVQVDGRWRMNVQWGSVSTSGTNQGPNIGVNAAAGALVTAGQVWSAGLKLRTVGATANVQVQAIVLWFNSAGSLISQTPTKALFTLPVDGTPVLVSVLGLTAPAGAVTLGVFGRVWDTSAVGTGAVQAWDAQANQGTSLVAFTDGDMPTGAWVGAAGASASTGADVAPAKAAAIGALAPVVGSWVQLAPNARGRRTTGLLPATAVPVDGGLSWTGPASVSNAQIGLDKFPVQAGPVMVTMQLAATADVTVQGPYAMFFGVTGTLLGASGGFGVTMLAGDTQRIQNAVVAPAGTVSMSLAVQMAASDMFTGTLTLTDITVTAGRQWRRSADGDDAHARWDGVRAFSTSTVLTAPSGVTVIAGDSHVAMAAGGGVPLWQHLRRQGLDVIGMGLSGDTSTGRLLALQGMRVTFPSGQIATGTGAQPVTLELSGVYRPGTSFSQGWIAGVRGTLGVTSSGATFTRTADGAAVTVLPDTPFVPAVGWDHADQVIWMAGANLANADAAIRDAIRVRDRCEALGQRFWCMAVYHAQGTAAGSEYTQQVETNERYAAEFGRAFLDQQAFVQQHGLDLLGITPTEADTAALAADGIPVSLRAAGDNVHMSDQTRSLVAKWIMDQITNGGI